MKNKLIVAFVTILISSNIFAEGTVKMDEMSNSNPKASLSGNEVSPDKEVKIETKVEPKTEVKTEVKKEKVSEVKAEAKTEIDPELAAIDPNVKPDAVSTDFVLPKTEEKKVTTETQVTKPVVAEKKITPEINQTTLSNSIEVPLTETEPKVKRSHAKKESSSSLYDEVVTSRPKSPSDRIRAYRQRMEEKNSLMVQKKIEEIRIRQEIELSKKIQDSMNQTLKAIDNI